MIKITENKFEEFFEDELYQEFKNCLFNYRTRKYFVQKEIENAARALGLDNVKVLDAGCGISPVAPKGSEFMELSPRAVKILRSKGYNAFSGDITKIPRKSGSYDIVCSSEVLEHVKNPEKALKECFRVLRSGGYAIVTVPMYKRYWMKDDKWVGHIKRFEMREMHSILKKAGFKSSSVRKIGSIPERLITRFITGIYMGSSGGKKPSILLKAIFPFWKIGNYLLFLMMVLFAYICPVKWSSIVLFRAKKNGK